MRKADTHRKASSPTGHNIEAIAKLEHDALKNRAFSERVAEAIVRVIGSVCFLFFNLFLTIFVLMSPNRILRQSDRRSHLDLQIAC